MAKTGLNVDGRRVTRLLDQAYSLGEIVVQERPTGIGEGCLGLGIRQLPQMGQRPRRLLRKTQPLIRQADLEPKLTALIFVLSQTEHLASRVLSLCDRVIGLRPQ